MRFHGLRMYGANHLAIWVIDGLVKNLDCFYYQVSGLTQVTDIGV